MAQAVHPEGLETNLVTNKEGGVATSHGLVLAVLESIRIGALR